ncbi:MAG: hypothetical protein P1U68_07150 [Verrucomicrobiales bacterium]|nr:hypothetical protein [Verrucomicrobiales bacterium]
MASGFGYIDYVVVALCVLIAAHFLWSDPQRLLLLLPTIVTVDFFIPLISQMTPGRLVPLIIGLWWCISGRFPTQRPVANWLRAGLVITVAATVYALLSKDSGIRPLIRSLNYINLIILCGFAWQFTRSEGGITRIFKGFSFAALIHGGYAIYQVVANRLGLPYRGIVYSAHKEAGSGAMSEGGFRINGFADEPKRLGLILLAGVLAMLFLAAREKRMLRKQVGWGMAIGLLLVSLMTYSASYLAALVAWAVVVMLFSPRSWKYGVVLVGVAFLLMVFMKGRVDSYLSIQKSLWDSRQAELESGIEGRRVYRQEFYAEDYLKERPLTVASGVGLGRYYQVFRERYGLGVGIGVNGNLIPLNSQVLEILFDMGIAGLFLLYGGGLVVVIKVRNRGSAGYMMALILSFELVQSVFVQSLPLVMLALGAGATLIWGSGAIERRPLRNDVPQMLPMKPPRQG